MAQASLFSRREFLASAGLVAGIASQIMPAFFTVPKLPNIDSSRSAVVAGFGSQHKSASQVPFGIRLHGWLRTILLNLRTVAQKARLLSQTPLSAALLFFKLLFPPRPFFL